MCFGGGGSMPKTEIKYEKPDYGPLPSTQVTQVQRPSPVYGDVKRGGETRSLLMPYQLGSK